MEGLCYTSPASWLLANNGSTCTVPSTDNNLRHASIKQARNYWGHPAYWRKQQTGQLGALVDASAKSLAGAQALHANISRLLMLYAFRSVVYNLRGWGF